MYLAILFCALLCAQAQDWQCNCQPPGDGTVECGHGCQLDSVTGLTQAFVPPVGKWDPSTDFGAGNWQLTGNKLTAQNGKWLCNLNTAQSGCQAGNWEHSTQAQGSSCPRDHATTCRQTCDAGYTPPHCPFADTPTPNDDSPMCLGGAWTPFKCTKIGHVFVDADDVNSPAWQTLDNPLSAHRGVDAAWCGDSAGGKKCYETCFDTPTRKGNTIPRFPNGRCNYGAEVDLMPPNECTECGQTCVRNEDCARPLDAAWCHNRKCIETCFDTPTRNGANIPRFANGTCNYGIEAKFVQNDCSTCDNACEEHNDCLPYGLMMASFPSDDSFIGSMKWGPICSSSFLRVILAGNAKKSCGGDQKFVRVYDADTHTMQKEFTLAELMPNQGASGDSPSMPSQVDLTGLTPGRVYLEFVDLDKGAHGCGAAFIAFSSKVEVVA